MRNLFRSIAKAIFVYAFQQDIERVKRMSLTRGVDWSDIAYLGKSDDYWNGSADGLIDALKILEIEQFGDK